MSNTEINRDYNNLDNYNQSLFRRTYLFLRRNLSSISFFCCVIEPPCCMFRMLSNADSETIQMFVGKRELFISYLWFISTSILTYFSSIGFFKTIFSNNLKEIYYNYYNSLYFIYVIISLIFQILNTLDIVYIQKRYRQLLNHNNLFSNRNINCKTFITFINCIQNIIGFNLTFREQGEQVYIPQIHRFITLNINTFNCEPLNNNKDICYSVNIISYYYLSFIQIMCFAILLGCLCIPINNYINRRYNINSSTYGTNLLRASLFSRNAIVRLLSDLQNTNSPPENDVCSICSTINDYNQWKILNCGHQFHTECITEWIMKGIEPVNEKCPICRVDINPN